ncbi:tetratricopeptide repeat protein [Dactylosporangium sp. NPDC005572]|uniref:tetratricopeptide repeat protein n=1 Tax=Dactylosporangium sp. NPDC005572 TaxID=3156889 RepID=UPI0033ABE0B7
MGRDEVLAEIEQRLPLVALSGLGGIGKSTTALEYAYRHLTDYDLVWTFHAEEATSLQQQYHELAELLDPAGLLDRSDPVARVHGALARRDKPWLLILDNVRDHAAARRWLPPPKGNGHVLVTTRDGHWPAAQAIHLDGLPRSVAAQFLLNQAGEYDLVSAGALADELGGLPLALAQAGGYVAATGRSLAEYLTLLREDRAGLLGRGAPSEHRTPVIATWTLAFEDLRASSPGSITLLRLLSCLAPEDIPYRLLLEERRPPELAGRFALDDAVAGLRRHSLIGPPSATVSVHRLVQALTLDQLDPDERGRWKATAAALVRAAVPENVTGPAARRACVQLLPHALAVLDLLDPAMWRLAEAIGEDGDTATARAVWQELADAHTARLGEEHLDTLAARNQLALKTGDAGDPQLGRDLAAALIPVCERAAGPEHELTLAVRSNLAHLTGEAGDSALGRDMYAALLPVYERIYGPEHPQTLTTRNSVAAATSEAGDDAAARDMYLALLPAYERVFGPEDPHLLLLRNNLAACVGAAGDAARARDLFAALLPVSERVLGPEHPDTLTAWGGLARWTAETGDVARAGALYVALLPIKTRVHGPEHPGTLAVRASLATCVGKAGDPVRAREMIAALLPVRERVLGAGHPDTVNIRENLAYWVSETGDQATARDLYAEVLAVRERVQGTDHPQTVGTRTHLAYAAAETGDTRRARDEYAALVGSFERTLGPEHRRTVDARNALALCTAKEGDAARARDLFAQVVAQYERLLGHRHPETVTARGNLAYCTRVAAPTKRRFPW